MVLRRIDGLIRLRVVAAFAVAIRVEDERRPSLRLLFVTRLVEALRVEPADHWSAAARPQRSIRILGEHQMMCAEAGVDVRQLLRFGIVHRELPPGTIEWKEPSRRMTRAFLAKRWIIRGTYRGGDPDAALLVHHRVVDVVLARPDGLGTPVDRWRAVVRSRGRLSGGIANSERHTSNGVVHWIEHRQIIRAQLRRAIDQTIRVQRRIASIRRYEIVQ